MLNPHSAPEMRREDNMDERKYYTNLDKYEAQLRAAEQRRLLKQAFPKPATNRVSLYRKSVAMGASYLASMAHRMSDVVATRVNALRDPDPECDPC
jgi:hypothetical protein